MFIESLKRLYSQDKIRIEKLQGLLDGDKITQDEFNSIIRNED